MLNASVAIVLACMGVFCVSITYSKMAMLMGGMGLIAWGFVLLRSLVDRKLRKPFIVMLAILFALAFANANRVTQYIKDVDTFIYYKFHNLSHNSSIEGRLQYFVIVTEIVSQHPLLGVGYGGFYDATIATERYKNPKGHIAEENAEGGAMGKSNPHNSFLYYASANGLPGLLLTLPLFVMTLHAFLRAFSLHGLTGKLLWVCLACAYFIYANCVPSIFNTAILYIPTAVAIAITQQHRPVSPTSRHGRD